MGPKGPKIGGIQNQQCAEIGAFVKKSGFTTGAFIKIGDSIKFKEFSCGIPREAGDLWEKNRVKTSGREITLKQVDFSRDLAFYEQDLVCTLLKLVCPESAC